MEGNMQDFTAFREQITYHENIQDLAERYDIEFKIAKYVYDELKEKNINSDDTDMVSPIIRVIKLREEPKSKKQLRSEEKQQNIEFLRTKFKNEKLRKESIDKKFKSMFGHDEV